MMGKYFILEDNIRHSYISVVWSHKIQEKQADILIKRYNCLEIVRLICTALTSVGLFTLFLENQFIIKLIATIISLVSTVISLIFKSFDTQKSIVSHKKSANELLIMREKFRLLIVDIKTNQKSISELSIIHNNLVEELVKVYESAPNTTEKAVKLAKKALNINRDNEFSDEEIDRNLPKSLRKKN